MADDFYPFVDSGDPAPDNRHLNGVAEGDATAGETGENVRYATRIAVYDDMLSTPRVIVIEPRDVRSYLEEITNTVYRCMKEQGGNISLMVIREIVENFIHAHFMEPIISIMDGGDTVRFADQGPGIEDKERAFEFGVTSADRGKKRYIRGTGAGFPMVQQYLENAGGAVSIEDNLGQGTVVTVTVDPARTQEVALAASRGGAVRGGGRPMALEQAAAPMGAYGSPAMPAHASPGMPGTMPAGANQAWNGGYPAYSAQPYGQPYAQGYPQAVPGYGAYAGQQAWGGYPGGGYAPQPWQGGAAPGWQGYAQPQGWQQAGMPGGASAMPAPAVGPAVSERGAWALGFLAQHGIGGPTELAAAFGSSNATWSRELEALTQAGLVIKHGQKRVLTDMGRAWLENQAPSAPMQQ